MADKSTPNQLSVRLTDEEHKVLLQLAREALSLAVRGEAIPPLDQEGLPPRLLQPEATFVTLTKLGELRGCIGSLEASRPLAEDVRVHAVAAALEDYRFPRVHPDETAQILIEISRLTTPKLIDSRGRKDLLTQIRPGIDGVILKKGVRRATFLPQVWNKVPDVEEFLGMLCRKMGAPIDCWQHEDVKVFTYQVEKFQEEGTM
jgi:AmmeMemoRadiSam system protein A